MITFDLTQENPVSITGAAVGSKDGQNKKEISFSALLKEIKESDDSLKNGLLSLSLKDLKTNKESTKVSKEDLLSSILQEADSSRDDLKFFEINPKLKESLSLKDFKQLIKDAKSYLKDQITATDGFKSSEIKKLPKTVKGLMQTAEKIGIDLSKITLEEVRQKPVSDINKSLSGEERSISLKESKPISCSNTLTTFEKKKKNPVEVNSKKSGIAEQEIEVKDSYQKTLLKESRTTPLFQAKKTTVDISTEQIVHSKAVNNLSTDLQRSKKSNNETLKLLLQGEKTFESEDLNMTKDFSVATAKVVAPALKSEKRLSLESLLQPELTGDDDKLSLDTKTEALQLSKTESFKVKLNEAKQMIKYLSQDVKTAIDNYKAPFTRVKVQLNPQQLGTVELTVVQRGKNLHVNLSSNNAAINTLAMNANDLKVQLQNSGINNASLNFSNNSQGENQAASQQQQQQNRQNAQKEYNYFENEERNEEIISSLEIIVPNYA